MNMVKVCLAIPSYRLWLLGSAAALMVFVIWSQVSHVGEFSNTPYAHLLPRRIPAKGADAPPILAYWVVGSKGESKRILRLLKAIYHPRNQYLLQLDSATPDQERRELALSVNSERVFLEFGNVNVVGESYAINPAAASGLAAVLHAAALLLRVNADWHWFIPLSTSDYPILTQDGNIIVTQDVLVCDSNVNMNLDILYAFSSLPKDVIFMEFNNGSSWEKSQIVVDPNLYLTENTPIYYAVETREKPDAFEIFGGSPWMVLTRGFLEHCVNGWDNLPRKLLMYFNNVFFPLESYFQTVLCNTPEFRNTTLVNHNLRCTVQDTNIGDPLMVRGAILARPFGEDDPDLQEIDKKLLNRTSESFVPGKWCQETRIRNDTAQNLTTNGDFCSVSGDIDTVQPGARGINLQKFFSRVTEEKKLASSQCQSHVMHKETKQ